MIKHYIRKYNIDKTQPAVESGLWQSSNVPVLADLEDPKHYFQATVGIYTGTLALYLLTSFRKNRSFWKLGAFCLINVAISPIWAATFTFSPLQ